MISDFPYHSFPPSSLDRRCFELIVFPKNGSRESIQIRRGGGHFRNQETHNHQMCIIGSHRRLHHRVKLKVRQVGQPTKNKWQYHSNITMKRCACESRQNDASIFCHKWIRCEIRNGHCEYKHTRHSNWAQNLPVQNKGSTLWFQKDTHQHF